MVRKRLILIPAVLLLLLSLCACGLRVTDLIPGGGNAGAPASQRTEAPKFKADITFTTVDMNGRSVSEQDLAGASLTMINYWAYWCGPCVNEMPDLQKLYETYRSRGFMIWGIADQEDEAQNKKTIAQLGITYPCLRYVRAFDDALQTGYVPTTIFIDGTGKIVGETYVGSHSYNEWAAIVEKLLP